jgi:protein-S-isoprenylcysteine O-methyltransferase Ste14
MTASDFEFRHRFWFISGIFFAGFGTYWLDGVPAATLLGDGRARWVAAAGAAIVALGAALRTWGTAYLRREVVRDTRVHVERLVADGPYRHVRNPLYLGTILLGVGMGTLASRVGFVVIALGMSLFALRLIAREEQALAEAQGESYRAYLRAVPRLVPSLRARVPAGGAAPAWRQALLGELYMWTFAAATAVYAATGSLQRLWILLAVSFCAYAASRIVRR